MLMHFHALSSFQATANAPPIARKTKETNKYLHVRMGIREGVLVTCYRRTASGAAAPTTPHQNLYHDQSTSIGIGP